MNDPEQCAAACAYQNKDIICIHSCSGYRIYAYDPRGKETVLGVDADNGALGIAVWNALAGSRFPSLKEFRDFVHYQLVQERYAERIKSLMARQGYKTKAALFRNMKSCSITLFQNTITMVPKIHTEMEAWGRKKDDGIEDVFIPADSLPNEIGAAWRLAFSRCVEQPDAVLRIAVRSTCRCWRNRRARLHGTTQRMA